MTAGPDSFDVDPPSTAEGPIVPVMSPGPDRRAERPRPPTPAGLLDDVLCHQAPGLVTRVAEALTPDDVLLLVHAIERAERVKLNRATGVDLDRIMAEARDRLEALLRERFGEVSDHG